MANFNTASNITWPHQIRQIPYTLWNLSQIPYALWNLGQIPYAKSKLALLSKRKIYGPNEAEDVDHKTPWVFHDRDLIYLTSKSKKQIYYQISIKSTENAALLLALTIQMDSEINEVGMTKKSQNIETISVLYLYSTTYR